jgi:trk system potassium uptake protein TrkH
MVLGALNFIVLAGIVRGKWRQLLKSEVSVFIALWLASIAVVRIVFGLGWFDSTFHTISMMSTAGFGYLPAMSEGLKLFFCMIMFIGGASLSTAGGIKIYRLVVLGKAVKKAVSDSITGKDSKLTTFGREYSHNDVIQVMASIIMTAGIVFFSALILSSYGHTFTDSIFDSTAAITTGGYSVGIVGPSLDIELKWLFMALMIIGRVEIMAILIAFSYKI